MKFSEMTYTRPDIDALLADCKALAAKAAAAPDGDALVAVYYEQSRAFADYTTASQLANIHYTCDTRDASWKAGIAETTSIPTMIKVASPGRHCSS